MANTEEVIKKARELMDKHNLKHWDFGYDTSKKRFGCCNYNKKMITLSFYLTQLNKEEDVMDTILHEIAHALVPNTNHGYEWRKKAMEIGCCGSRCYDSKKIIQPTGKWQAVCKVCGNIVNKQRKPNCKMSCGKCCRHYDEKYLLEFKEVN